MNGIFFKKNSLDWDSENEELGFSGAGSGRVPKLATTETKAHSSSREPDYSEPQAGRFESLSYF
jgi:hypothetical protein